MAELRTVNPLVAGSSPALGAMEDISNFICLDCSANTLLIREYYMVKHSVWAQSKLGSNDGMLCIACLERRISRHLVYSDFARLPINTTHTILRSPRLESRLNMRKRRCNCVLCTQKYIDQGIQL